MIRRAVVVAVGTVVVVAGWIGWQRWAALSVVTLPPVPVPAHQPPAPCDEQPATYHLDGGTGPPPSWRAAVSAAAVDAVLVARVTGEKPQVMDVARCLWNTAYPLAVEE